jgi:hypothetical protein
MGISSVGQKVAAPERKSEAGYDANISSSPGDGSLNTSQQSLASLVSSPDGIQERFNSRHDTTGDLRKKGKELVQSGDTIRAHALGVKAQPSVTALMELHNEAIERLRVQHKAELVTLNAELAAARANAAKLRKRESWLYKALFGAGLFMAYLVRS